MALFYISAHSNCCTSTVARIERDDFSLLALLNHFSYAIPASLMYFYISFRYHLSSRWFCTFFNEYLHSRFFRRYVQHYHLVFIFLIMFLLEIMYITPVSVFFRVHFLSKNRATKALFVLSVTTFFKKVFKLPSRRCLQHEN